MDKPVSNMCKLCNVKESIYVCPRCNIPYCSLPCYQSQAHVQCSESFYKEAVVEHIQSNDLDPESQQNMVEILQRVQQIDSQLQEDEVTDSDDDSDGEDLADRLAGVNLDDADQVWERLTAEEKRQFEELLKTGDVSTLVPEWQPWWFYSEKKLLVEDIENCPHPDVEPEWKSACPAIKENLQPLSQLSKVTPSPCVRWSVVNVLAAYSVTARVFNGDHLNAALEAATMVVTLSTSLSANQVFESPEMAVAAVHMAAVNSNCVVEGMEEQQLKEDVQRLVEGPSEEQQRYYTLAALSDVDALLSLAKRKVKECRSSKNKGEFSKKFPDSSSSTSSELSTTDLTKHMRKIEFFLSWTVQYF